MNKLTWTLCLVATLIATPVLADQKADQLKAGATLYDNNCAACHGDEGKGDGPQARFLSPRPADLTAAKLKHGDSDQDLFNTISKGVDGTAMNPWARSLKEDEIHALVAYVQSLRKPAATSSK